MQPPLNLKAALVLDGCYNPKFPRRTVLLVDRSAPDGKSQVTESLEREKRRCTRLSGTEPVIITDLCEKNPDNIQIEVIVKVGREEYRQKVLIDVTLFLQHFRLVTPVST